MKTLFRGFREVRCESNPQKLDEQGYDDGGKERMRDERECRARNDESVTLRFSDVLREKQKGSVRSCEC